MQRTARDRFVWCGPIRLYVREVGSGRPLVVVHGGPDFNHRYLVPELDRLAECCRLVYYDQRGRGRSFAVAAAIEVTMQSEVDDLDAVRRRLGLDTVALLGHSWGALVAMEYALAFPEQVSHLIVMNPAPASPDDAAILRERLRAGRSAEQSITISALESDPGFQAGDIKADAAYYRIHFATALQRSGLLEVLVARLRRDFTAEGIVAARAIEQRLYEQTWENDRYDLLTRLEQARHPTLVIHGDADLIPVEVARHIAEAIPNARLEVLDDCGHFAFLDQPERTEDVITRFLATATTPGVKEHVGESVARPTSTTP
jgi:proline iminopeptidase